LRLRQKKWVVPQFEIVPLEGGRLNPWVQSGEERIALKRAIQTFWQQLPHLPPTIFSCGKSGLPPSRGTIQILPKILTRKHLFYTTNQYMTSQEILKQLKTMGKESTAKVLMKHGAKEPCYGVKIEDSKKLLKPVKGNLAVAKDLFNSGVYDAMYLAGLVADGSTMTKKELDTWAKSNYGGAISEYTVPWVACESQYGFELALEWITSKSEFVAVSGWATLANMVCVKEDAELDLKKIKSLLDQVEKEVHASPNRVRYVMNGFVICVGSYIASLSEYAIKVAGKIGPVKVNVGDTACKVPQAVEYINKAKAHGSLSKKKKNIKC
jgi:hypothetical protein